MLGRGFTVRRRLNLGAEPQWCFVCELGARIHFGALLFDHQFGPKLTRLKSIQSDSECPALQCKVED